MTDKCKDMLQALADCGWKPWNIQEKVQIDYMGDTIYVDYPKDGYCPSFSMNDLCSWDSGLWQFVLELGFYDPRYRDVKMSVPLVGDIRSNNIHFWVALSSLARDKAKFIEDNVTV